MLVLVTLETVTQECSRKLQPEPAPIISTVALPVPVAVGEVTLVKELTINEALAVPLSPVEEVRLPLVLFNVPLVLAVTSTDIVQVLLLASKPLE